MKRLNGFGWFAVAVSLASSLVMAGCGSVGAPKPSVEFKVAVPVKTLHKQNFAWGERANYECLDGFHQECVEVDENGNCIAGDCVPD